MAAPPAPPWLHPDARLIQDGLALDAASLLALAAAIRPDGGKPLAVQGRDIGQVAAHLIAAWQQAFPLALLRGGLPAPDTTGETGAVLLLESSGTTGTPKRLAKPLSAVLAGIGKAGDGGGGRWLLTYDAGGFAGLQVLLTVLIGGGTLLAATGADLPTLARLAVREGVTHLSSTPSFWRGLLLSGQRPPLAAITLGGEAADQPLLDALANQFPQARIRHIYASTEQGRLFSVADGKAGFPARWLEQPPAGCPPLTIRGGTLHVGDADTGDRVGLAGDRVLFQGRADLTINVGGTKVDPLLAEGCLLALPGMRDAVVYGIPSPITGQLLAADLLLSPEFAAGDWRAAVAGALTDLPPPARPRRLRLVDQIALLPSGKKRRIAEEA
ncbi:MULTISPECIES: AMP-binding protein [unclassified Azospirillum]|uniref:AMP-binding protein n=1 Tax=unclassified Azospirillum TaxID=2630922 RepID=UPI000B648DCB|nr:MULTISPECIES: AMP-binding protein [unclassified Azospirillum]SNS78401.1 Acyl-CoA synthetase (AMP-forming)/AMP-acid ligase II [Azospirillum sp. RU38E]SNS95667.1 Acyl-CoA synthetase (AMP-forming)/AMP-acid ligase II [Azospirillum sp. RU37A]